VPGLSEGITSPVICVVIEAASRSICEASITLKPPQGAVAPVSSATILPNSAALEARTSAALSRSVRRSLGPIAAQEGKAAAAASTAFLASATLPDGARLAISPVKGFLRSKTAPPAAPTVSPPINILMSMDSSHTAVTAERQLFAARIEFVGLGGKPIAARLRLRGATDRTIGSRRIGWRWL
jgi:hypothetical protein